MLKHSKLKKAIVMILCVSMFFTVLSSTMVVQADGIIEGAVSWLWDKILEWVTRPIIIFGDGVLHLIIRCVGEDVSVDKLVFGDVDKVNINYWEKGGESEIRTIISNVIQKWYGVFFKIAMVVYMILLVYIGINIMLSSTAQKKANYQERLVDWVVGITIMFMFPYVMKMVIMLNDALLIALADKAGFLYSNGTEGGLAKVSFFDAKDWYGEDAFVEAMGEDCGGGIMFTTRQAAMGGTATFNKSSPILGIVYLILIGQLIAILIMYYKRAFMIGFLITIFPLVGMSYVIDRIGDGKNQSFQIWFKEFLVNVLVQSFHATVYVLITGSVIQNYIANGGGNLIFLIIAVLFLFEGEKILRGIFDMNSKAGSISDLATSGAIVMSSASKMGGILKKDTTGTGSAKDKADSEAAQSRIGERTKSQQDNEKAAQEAMEANGNEPSMGEYQGKDNEPAGSKKGFDGQLVRDKLLKKGLNVRVAGGLAGKAVNLSASIVGGTLGATQQMAMGKISPADIMAGAAGGSALGKELASPLRAIANKGDQIASGAYEAHKVRSGRYDKELGLDGMEGYLPPSRGRTMSAGIPESPEQLRDMLDSPEVRRYEVDIQSVYREALARYVSKAARGGRESAEIAFWDYVNKETGSRSSR